MFTWVAEDIAPETELPPDISQYKDVPSSDICAVNVHGLGNPNPAPQVFVTSAPETLYVPSEVPGSPGAAPQDVSTLAAAKNRQGDKQDALGRLAIATQYTARLGWDKFLSHGSH